MRFIEAQILKNLPSPFLVGSMKRGGPVKRTDGGEQPEALVVKGVEIQGLQCLPLKQNEKEDI